MSADWSNLPADLLVAIAELLRIEDYTRLQYVCKPWRSVLKERPLRHQPHKQLPWLMLPDANSDTCPFYSFSDDKIHRIYLPELRGRRCCGSSYGWMVMVDKSPDVFMLNPLTRSQIPLPPITTLPEIVNFRVNEFGQEEYYYPNDIGQYFLRSGEFMQGRFFKKVILTANPSLTRDYIAMAIYGDMDNLAFCREGDCRWTAIRNRIAVDVEDIIYWKGSFYGVDCGARLFVCDLGGPVPNPNVKKILHVNFYVRRNYLVVSGEELLLVSRRLGFQQCDINDICSWRVDDDDHGSCYEVHYGHGNDNNGGGVDENANYGDDDHGEYNREGDDDTEEDEQGDVVDEEEGNGIEDVDDENYYCEAGYFDDCENEIAFLYKTKEIKVFKFDEKRLTWVDVTRLEGEDSTLFVGNNVGLPLSAKDFPECKPNHIYFIDDNSIEYSSNPYLGGHDLGGYNRKNREIEPFPCCPQSTWLIWPPPFWATLSPY